MEDIALFIPNERYQRAAGGKEKRRKNKLGGEFGKERNGGTKAGIAPLNVGGILHRI